MLAYILCWAQNNNVGGYVKEHKGLCSLWLSDILFAVFRGKDTHVWTWLYAPRNYSILDGDLEQSWDWSAEGQQFEARKFIACNANTIAMALYTICGR